MAAFTTTHNSDVYTRQLSAAKADPLDGDGTVKSVYAPYTHPAGDNGTGTIRMIRTRAGRIRIVPDNSRLVTSQFGASALISIGYDTYVNSAGATVAASTAALHSAGTAGAGALDVALGAPADGAAGLVLDSRDGVDIIATVAAGDIQATNTIGLRLEIVVIG